MSNHEILYISQFIDDFYSMKEKYNSDKNWYIQIIYSWIEAFKHQKPKVALFKSNDLEKQQFEIDKYYNRISNEIVKPIKDGKAYKYYYNEELSLKLNYQRNSQLIQNYIDIHNSKNIPLVKETVYKYIELKNNLYSELFLLQELNGFFLCLDKIIAQLIKEFWSGNDKPTLEILDIFSVVSHYKLHIDKLCISEQDDSEKKYDIRLNTLKDEYYPLNIINEVCSTLDKSFIDLKHFYNDTVGVVEMINELNYVNIIIYEDELKENTHFLSLEKIEKLHYTYFNKVYDALNYYHIVGNNILLNEIKQLLNNRISFWSDLDYDNGRMIKVAQKNNNYDIISLRFIMSLSHSKMNYHEILLEKLLELEDSKVELYLSNIEYDVETASAIYETTNAILINEEKIKIDYHAILDQYKHHFKKECIIAPSSFEEFYKWIETCRYPDTEKYDISIKAADFNFFHEYKDIMFNNSDWCDVQEIERLQSRFKEVSKEVKEVRFEVCKSNSVITEKMKVLFQFIEFLHKNIENFNKYNPAILEWKKARLEEREFGNHYTEKLKMREVQEAIKSKRNLLVEKIIDPIKSKANELSVCDLDEPRSIYTINSRDIILLIENFDVEDIEVIMRVKRLYLSLRNELNADIINLIPLFFRFFDEMMKHVAERFWEDGDIGIPKIHEITLEEAFKKPESLNICMTPEEQEKFFLLLLKEHQEVIYKETDFDYFAYAISGRELPTNKLPYKPVKIIGTIDSIYIELLNLMKIHSIIPERNKTIPKPYRDLAGKLFLNAQGKPLKLSTPK